MKNQEEVFCIYFKDNGKVKYEDFTEDNINDPDAIVITEKEVNALVEIELCDSCHDDCIEDYDTPLDFYLSNVTEDSYYFYLDSQLDDMQLNDDVRLILANEVAKRIKESF